MKWNKVNLKKNDKNLPLVKERVIWATNEGSIDDNIFYQFIGQLTEDRKFINHGYGQYKLTSNYWWMPLPPNPNNSKIGK